MWILAASIPILVVQCAMLYYFVHVGRRASRFISPRGENPSDFAMAIDAVADRVVVRMKMAVLGEKGGDAKAARSAEQGMMRDFVTSQNPMVALALDNFMPKWAKYFAANPELMGKGLEMMKKYTGKPDDPADGNQSSGVQIPLEIDNG